MQIDSSPNSANSFLSDSRHDYQCIESAIAYLCANPSKRPSTAELSEVVHLSKPQFERLLARWSGIRSECFLQLLRPEYTSSLLARLTEQFAANHDTKLSEPAAQHGPLVNIQALTRNEFKSKIKSFTIRYGQHPTPFGDCLVGITKHGICSLEFIPMDGVAPLLKQLAQRWPDAILLEDRDATAQAALIAFNRTQATNAPLNVFVQGTHFQIQVWRALLQIPSGHVCSYTSIAQQIGRPQAVRAVGSAIAANPIAWLIPCHRVLRSDGRLSGYHWGETRKQACLAWEAATIAGTV